MISRISNLSFKSTPLYDVKVKQKEGSVYKDVDAVFSKLNPKDKSDLEAIKRIKKTWGDSDYTDDIVDDFKDPNNDYLYYAVELKGDKSLSKRIVSLCEVCPMYLYYYINYLQSRAKSSYKDRDDYIDIKGAGEVMMYGITKVLKRKEYDRISLSYSDEAIDFYKGIGFIKEGRLGKFMYLPNEKFDSFIKKIEKKYNIEK